VPLENWKTIFETGGVILLGLTFLFGAGALITSRKVNELQAQQLREFDKDLTTAKMDLAKQQERAAHADERAAHADERADALEREVIRLGPRPPLLWGKARSQVMEKTQSVFRAKSRSEVLQARRKRRVDILRNGIDDTTKAVRLVRQSSDD